MNKAEKKFVGYAVLALFISLTVLLGVVNAVSFGMAAEDADRITERIAEGGGRFTEEDKPEIRPEDNRIGPMGPSSPEMKESLRYFTCIFDQGGAGRVSAYHISAMTEEEALQLASGLVNETTGWTKGIYRYRVYRDGKKTVVTVIDVGREMLSCYRILTISVIGDIIAVLLGWLILRILGRRIFSPLEEADRKEKQFMKNVEKEFKVPLTVIRANTELIDRTHGPGDETAAIRNEVNKMNMLVNGISTYTFLEEGMELTDLSRVVEEEMNRWKPKFEEAGKTLTAEVEEGAFSGIKEDDFRKVLSELLQNMLRYAESSGRLSLRKEGDRILLETENEAELEDGSMDHAFDRNTVLSNGNGLGAGLANVKEIIKGANGRARAEVKNRIFRVTISL